MAKMKTSIEMEYDESLEKFKQQAQQDAQRSKLFSKVTPFVRYSGN